MAVTDSSQNGERHRTGPPPRGQAAGTRAWVHRRRSARHRPRDRRHDDDLFSVTYGVLLKPLPWPEPDRLVRLEERRGGRPGRIPWTITNGTYLAWSESATVEDVGGWMSVTSTFSDGGEPERIRLGRLTPAGLHRPCTHGRSDGPGVRGQGCGQRRRSTTVILSHGFWQRRFGGAPDILGRSIRLDEASLHP